MIDIDKIWERIVTLVTLESHYPSGPFLDKSSFEEYIVTNHLDKMKSEEVYTLGIDPRDKYISVYSATIMKDSSASLLLGLSDRFVAESISGSATVGYYWFLKSNDELCPVFRVPTIEEAVILKRHLTASIHLTKDEDIPLHWIEDWIEMPKVLVKVESLVITVNKNDISVGDIINPSNGLIHINECKDKLNSVDVKIKPLITQDFIDITPPSMVNVMPNIEKGFYIHTDDPITIIDIDYGVAEMNSVSHYHH